MLVFKTAVLIMSAPVIIMLMSFLCRLLIPLVASGLATM
jgi:hypothetical protein